MKTCPVIGTNEVKKIRFSFRNTQSVAFFLLSSVSSVDIFQVRYLLNISICQGLL